VGPALPPGADENYTAPAFALPETMFAGVNLGLGRTVENFVVALYHRSSTSHQNNRSHVRCRYF
jgi:hypothetical protein